MNIAHIVGQVQSINEREIEVLVKRESGNKDEVIITPPACEGIVVDDFIEVFGELKTKKEQENGKTKMKLCVESANIKKVEDGNINEVVLRGKVSGYPHYRKTPLGKDITDLIIRVDDEFIHCVLWKDNAKWARYNLRKNDNVVCTGKAQSRRYFKNTPNGIQEYTARELSINTIRKEKTNEDLRRF